MKILTLVAVMLIVPLGLAQTFASPVLAQAGAEAASGAGTQADPGADAEATKEDLGGRTLADWYRMGGWVMHFLVLCSVLVVGLLLERMWALRRSAVIPRKFMREVMVHWRRRETQPVVALCAASDVAMARVLRAGLIRFDEGLSRMEDAIEVAGDHEATMLGRNLPLLSALGNIATMIGLLGTVLGMIDSFDIIAQTGTGDARQVAGGIFQALVTTAAGLIVGITAVGMHAYLRRKADSLEIELEETSFRLLEELTLQRGIEGEDPSTESGPAGLEPVGA